MTLQGFCSRCCIHCGTSSGRYIADICKLQTPAGRDRALRTPCLGAFFDSLPHRSATRISAASRDRDERRPDPAFEGAHTYLLQCALAVCGKAVFIVTRPPPFRPLLPTSVLMPRAVLRPVQLAICPTTSRRPSSRTSSRRSVPSRSSGSSVQVVLPHKLCCSRSPAVTVSSTANIFFDLECILVAGS